MSTDHHSPIDVEPTLAVSKLKSRLESEPVARNNLDWDALASLAAGLTPTEIDRAVTIANQTVAEESRQSGGVLPLTQHAIETGLWQVSNRWD